jgi:RNA 3'-terminal phosphate cyclase (ATP)
MVQMLLPILIFGKKESLLELRGGTSVGMSPPIRYTQKIFQPLIKRMGVDFELKVVREGYYPGGGGELSAKIENLEEGYIKPIEIITKGKIETVHIEVITKWNDEAGAAEHLKFMKKEVKKILRTKYSEEEVDNMKIETSNVFAEDVMKSGFKSMNKQRKNNKMKGYQPKEGEMKIIYGAMILAMGHNIYLGESSVNVDEFTEDDQYINAVLKSFNDDFNGEGCVDEHTQDQLLLFMALAKGLSKIKCGKVITDHTKSCLYIFEKFIPGLKYKITAEGECNIIEVEGIGFQYQPVVIKEVSNVNEVKKEEVKEM